MKKKNILALVYTGITITLATGAMLWFEGTHKQNPIMFEGYRELSDFSFANVWWPMVGITFALMVTLSLPWWAMAFDKSANETPRKFSLFPFLHLRGVDRFITMLNVFCLLGVTISLCLLAQMGLKDYDPTQAEHLRLYLTSLLLFWGGIYVLISGLSIFFSRGNKEG